MEELLKVEHLVKTFGKNEVLKDIDFSVQRGDVISIIGSSGSGKSTLMKTLLGFIKPLSGEVCYSPHWNKKELGYLPQTSEIQKNFPATVWEIVLSGRQGKLGIFPFYKKSDKQKAEEALKTVGMSDFASSI